HTIFSFSRISRPPSSTLFPYTTLFRSEEKSVEMVERDLANLRQLIAGSADLTRFVSSPIFSRADHVKGMKAVLGMIDAGPLTVRDRKSTRLNSSHVAISYAVFCLKKKK